MPTLPFLTEGTLAEPDGSTVSVFNVSVWPATGSNTDIGRYYDHEGQAPLSSYTDLLVQNRTLTAGGVSFKVVSATKHSFMPHVALRLREHRSGGGG